MKLSPLQKRAERHARNRSLVDLNLVSLIDIFTILIFFLLANASEVEVLPSTKAVRLPESTAEKTPKVTVVVVVSNEDILVQGRKVISVSQALNANSDLIEPLKAELDYHAGRQLVRKEQETRNKAVTIMGDKEIPYRLLRKIMVTCARANYSDLSFAVIQRGKA
ncbi:MAG TPA: biopolymer transporter ExbD [Burkholderiales bacterium]|nr:biopolymer transporter ExbD [Burkholderiales bacterium]